MTLSTDTYRAPGQPTLASPTVDDGLASRAQRSRWQRLARRFALDDRGQATTEYALILLAAAMVGLIVIGWATAGGGAAAIGGLFNRVISSIVGKI